VTGNGLEPPIEIITTGFCFPSSVALIAGIAGTSATLTDAGTAVAVGAGVGVAVFTGVGVDVGAAVGVGVGDAVGVGVAAGVEDAAGVGLEDRLLAGAGDADGLIGEIATLEPEHPTAAAQSRTIVALDRRPRRSTSTSAASSKWEEAVGALFGERETSFTRQRVGFRAAFGDHHVSMNRRDPSCLAPGAARKRNPLTIHERDSDGSITSSISKNDATLSAFPSAYAFATMRSKRAVRSAGSATAASSLR
jgi:hypothetical protein